MIPAIDTSSLHHALSHAHKPHAGARAEATQLLPVDPTGTQSPTGTPAQNATQNATQNGATNTARNGSIANDLGQLTTDALQLLGLGAKPGANQTTGQAATQAYATSAGLAP